MKPNGSRQSAGFTLVELLVVVGIIAILLALLLPALQRAEYQVRLSACANNLKQIATACNAYAADSNGFYPGYKVINGNPVPARGRSYDSTPAELGPYCGGSVNYNINPLWRCPEAYILARQLNRTATGYYSYFPNLQQGLYSGVLGYFQSSYIPQDPSEVLRRPDGSMKFNSWNFVGGRGPWEHTVLASDASQMFGLNGQLSAGHSSGVTQYYPSGGALSWWASDGLFEANYVYTDGSVQRSQFTMATFRTVMIVGADGPLQWDCYLIPKDRLRRYNP